MIMTNETSMLKEIEANSFYVKFCECLSQNSDCNITGVRKMGEKEDSYLKF